MTHQVTLKIQLILYLLFFLLSTNNTFAQTSSIEGRVCNTNGNAVEYFNAVLLSPNDSAIIKGGAFINGNFQFNNLEDTPYILMLSSIGYQKLYLNIDHKNKQYLPDNITLKTTQLKEVIITAINPPIKLKQNKLVLEVQNTYLSNLGTSTDVLKHTPMLMMDSQENIYVAGKENTIIYVDGIRVNSSHELDKINSSTIKQIEVITNPTAKYEASAQSVINIKTIKQKKSCFNGSVLLKSTKTKRLTNTFNPFLQYKNKKITFAGDYSLLKGNSKSEENRYTNNFIENVITDVRGTTTSNIQRHDYSLKTTYNITENSNLGIQYHGWTMNGDSETANTNQYNEKGLVGGITTKTWKKPEEKHNRYNVSYNLKIDSSGQNILFLTDYINHHKKSDENIAEISNDGTPFINSNKTIQNSTLELYSINTDYQLPIKSINLEISSGMKYSETSNNSSTNFFTINENNIWELNNNYTNNNDFKEKIKAFYFSLNKGYKGIDIAAGIRVEDTKFKGKSENSSTTVNQNYTKLFPNISLSYKFHDKLRGTINYSQKIKRPSYQRLNPFITYIDKYSYQQGNPYLKPTITDNIEATFSYLKLILKLGYSVKNDATIFQYNSDINNPSITKITLENHSKIKFISFNAAHTFSLQKYSSSNSFGIKKPFGDINYIKGNIKISNPLIYFKHTSQFHLGNKTTLYANLSYIDYGQILLEEKKPLYNLSAGINKKFLNNKLTLTVNANDILNTYNWKDTRQVNNYMVIHEYKPDNTYIRISARYNFGIKKSPVKSKTSLKDELKRL